jgi:hypothetical protein
MQEVQYLSLFNVASLCDMHLLFSSSLHSIYEWICGIFSLQVCDVAMAPTLTMSWLYDVCTMLVGIRDYANIHYKLGISVIYFFKL